MALATGGNASAFVSGGNPLIAYKLWSPKSCSFVKAPTLTVQNNFNRQIACHKLPAHTQYKCAASKFGIRRSLLNEDEYGFHEAKQPIYYDEGLEKTRQTVNDKINQLNSAIDNVSSRLRGGHSMPLMPIRLIREKPP